MTREKFIATVKKELPQWEELLAVESLHDHAQSYVDKYNAAIKYLETAPDKFFSAYAHLAKDADSIVEMTQSGWVR
jgi:NAD-dependent SIR2 family protein deacetylase